MYRKILTAGRFGLAVAFQRLNALEAELYVAFGLLAIGKLAQTRLLIMAQDVQRLGLLLKYQPKWRVSCKGLSIQLIIKLFSNQPSERVNDRANETKKLSAVVTRWLHGHAIYANRAMPDRARNVLSKTNNMLKGERIDEVACGHRETESGQQTVDSRLRTVGAFDAEQNRAQRETTVRGRHGRRCLRGINNARENVRMTQLLARNFSLLFLLFIFRLTL